MKVNIEAQGGELVLRNENGDTIIVPRNRRNEAMKYLLKDDHHSLDKLALDLPKAEHYASGGTVIPEDPIEGMMGPETTITADNPKKSIGNFLNRWGYEHSKDPATSFLGAVGQGLGAIAQLPQAAATYLSSPKGRVLPSQAIQDSGYNEKVKAFANRNPNMVGALAQLTTKPGIQNFALDPLNYVGGEFLKGEKALINDLPIENGKIYKQDWLKGYKQIKTPKSTLSPISKSWQIQDLPGLHLQSTMSNGPISKIIEPKTGLINTEQALAIIAKESGGNDKVVLIRQGLGENIPKKMDYNEFRQSVQDQLIPLERQFSEQASNYGVGRLGYPSPKRSSYEKAIEHNEYMIEHYKKQIAAGSDNSSLKGDLQNAINNLENSKKELATLPLENQTLILGNKGKFGRGSSAHGNPDETLGHVHLLRDAETPDVLTVTQIQSDAFQGTHRIMPKTFNKEQELRGLSMMEDKLKARELDYSKAKKLPNGDYKFDDGLVMDKTLYEQGLTVQREMNAMKKAEIENFTQKQLLDKNHQERYLQELVDYAGKKGMNKVRVPTSETAAKVQGYSKIEMSANKDFVNPLPNNATDAQKVAWNEHIETIKSGDKSKLKIDYSPEHQTILKKYSEQPKTIKKLFKEEPKVVTDSKGNTWYEFDIPKKFKEGKGEIKALSTLGATLGVKQIIDNNKQQ